MIVSTIVFPHPPLMLPEIGHGEEAVIEQTITACKDAARTLMQSQPDVIVVLSPHTILYSDYFHISPGEGAEGNFTAFGAPEVSCSIRYDTQFVQALIEQTAAAGLPAGTEGQKDAALDHATMLPMMFLAQEGTLPPVVRVGMSGLPLLQHYQLGQCIAATQPEKRVAIVASSDLSHRLSEDGQYGYSPQGEAFDSQISDILSGAEFGRLFDITPECIREAGECGLRPIVMMAGALDGLSVEGSLLSYQAPLGVGYAVAAYHVGEQDAERHEYAQYTRRLLQKMQRTRRKEDAYVQLARTALEHYIQTGEALPLPDDLPAELLETRAATFVSLKLQGELRGCIGTLEPTQKNVALEIVRNAISAGTQDPRFPAVREHELPAIIYSVDVLQTPEIVDSPADLNPRRYGVIVSKGTQRGVLLPNLPGVFTVPQQIEIAKQKAGIRSDAPVTLARFKVVRHT